MALTANDDGTYTVTVNGVETQVSGDDLLKMAQKGESADKRFQEAAAIKKEVEGLIQSKGADLEIANNLRKALQGNDQTAMLAAMTALGMPEQEVKKYLEPAAPAPKADNGLTAADKARLKWFEELTDAAQANGIDAKTFMQSIAQDRKAKGKEAIQAKFVEFLEKDPEMGTMMKKADTRKDVLRLAQSILSHKFVEGETQNLDEAAISGSARDVSETLKRLLGDRSASDGSISLGNTPTAPVGFAGKPVTPIKRPPIFADTTDRENYLEQRLAQMAHEASHPESD